MVVSFGLLFLNGATVFAEETDELIDSQESVSDVSDSSSEKYSYSDTGFNEVSVTEPVVSEETVTDTEQWQNTVNASAVPDHLITIWYRVNAPQQIDPSEYSIPETERYEPIIDTTVFEETETTENAYVPVEQEYAAVVAAEDSEAVSDALMISHPDLRIDDDLSNTEPKEETGIQTIAASERIISPGMHQLTMHADTSSDLTSADVLSAVSPETVVFQTTNPIEFIISGEDIPLANGTYSFRLVIRSDKTLTFDNKLENTYQGIDGDYKLHYNILPDETHTMIVDGAFANIITASPLIEKLPEAAQEWIDDHISEDSYLYQLALETGKGFSFNNALGFLFDEKKTGFSLKYCYDLLKKKSSLIINGIPICKMQELETGQSF